MKHKHSNESGFTLIELLVTCVFVAAMSTTIVEVFVTIGTVNRQARNLTAVTEMAQQKMEADRNLPFLSIPASEDFSSAFSSLQFPVGNPRSAVATFNDLTASQGGPQPGLKELDINITYTDGGQTKNVKVSTFITQVGIDR